VPADVSDPTNDPVPADTLPERPSSARMGLLEYLSASSVDEDYAFVSARRKERGEEGRRPRRAGPLGAVVMALFAVLVVTAAAQTSRNAVSDAAERSNLAGQVRDAQQELDADRTQLLSLRRETTRLQSSALTGDRSTRAIASQLARLGALTGARAVRGPGVRVVADDAVGANSARNEVLDTDLQRLVNGFWEAGAEAIALNGQRLTNLSTIRTAGGAITVNATSLRPPYVVQVIGDKDTLPARFAESSSGQAWLDLQRDVGLRLTITPVDTLRLPATEVSLRYATSPTTGGDGGDAQ
jgi:uncharacterized protein YlxW (UPF0749 family)